MIRDFIFKGPQPTTRRDHALKGRLHISQIENKIKCYDNDIPSFIYKWKAEQPLSALDMEVTFRLQSTAARFFQSIGDFGAAQASLEEFLSLDTTKPIRVNTRRVLVGRLADMYCEMGEYTKAMEMVQTELTGVDEGDRLRRGFRRLILASAEANIGLQRLDATELVLRNLENAVPLGNDNLHDQQLHMRTLLVAARIAHYGPDPNEAVIRWKLALDELQGMYTLGSSGGFTAAMVYLSLAHAKLITGDKEGGQHTWTTGLEILRREKCEFWIPVVPTAWIRKVAMEVYDLQGWPFRMMLPGGKPDVTQLSL